MNPQVPPAISRAATNTSWSRSPSHWVKRCHNWPMVGSSTNPLVQARSDRKEARVMGINRRTFLGAATGAILSAEGISLGAPQTDAKPQAANERNPSTLAEPPEGIDYFTQQRLERAIDLSVPIDGIDFQAVCYTFNPWHPSPWMEQR